LSTRTGSPGLTLNQQKGKRMEAYELYQHRELHRWAFKAHPEHVKTVAACRGVLHLSGNEFVIKQGFDRTSTLQTVKKAVGRD
jgi:hypothetical protein